LWLVRWCAELCGAASRGKGDSVVCVVGWVALVAPLTASLARRLAGH
jgi:hypothetical protein